MPAQSASSPTTARSPAPRLPPPKPGDPHPFIRCHPEPVEGSPSTDPHPSTPPPQKQHRPPETLSAGRCNVRSYTPRCSCYPGRCLELRSRKFSIAHERGGVDAWSSGDLAFAHWDLVISAPRASIPYSSGLPSIPTTHFCHQSNSSRWQPPTNRGDLSDHRRPRYHCAHGGGVAIPY